MNCDQKRIYTVSALYLGVLLLVCWVSNSTILKFLLATTSVLFAILAYFLIKKRSILALESRQASLLIVAIVLAVLMLYYITGLYFDFTRVVMPSGVFGRYILPIVIIVISSEILRSILLAQKKKSVTILTYLTYVLLDTAMRSDFDIFRHFSAFMNTLGMMFFPAITANLLCHYLSTKYGALPCILYRLPLAIYSFVIPLKPQMPDILLSFFRIILPLVIYLFIHALYTRRKFTVSRHSIRFQIILTSMVLFFMITIVMLISCQFRYGLIVIATESMTGDLDKGDALIYENYDDQIIHEGQIIVFEKNTLTVIHRVVDIQHINGELQYYTRGDANNANDSGFITDDQIIGISSLRIKYLGYPTLWIRELFK